MNYSPLVSLCIPTKNRAALLDKCLHAIFSSEHFDDELIEVVVSDNASTDNTQQVVEKYLQTQKHLVYNRNKENLGKGGDLNFIKVLSLAHGKMLKLMNDYTTMTDEGIKFYIEYARKNANTMPTSFFIENKEFDERLLPTMDEFVKMVAWSLTWIGNHVYWKKTWDALPDKTRAINTYFMQADWTLRLYNEKQPVHVVYGNFFHNLMRHDHKMSYNWFDVHMTYFFSVLKPYVDTGDISKKTYDRVKKILFKAMCRSFKAMCFRSSGCWDESLHITRMDVIKIFYRNYKEYKWFYPRFAWYVSKLYVKEWIGYWWLQRKFKKKDKHNQ